MSPGANLQGLIDANPAGTTFCFGAGTYRLTTALDPKSNDVFIGAPTSNGGPGSVLNGSKVVTSWTQSGSLWYSTGQTQQLPVEPNGDPGYTRCEGSYTGCLYDEELYLDNTSLWQVTSKSELVPGTFYFDYAADTIWIADNPSGHLLEASTELTKALIGTGKYNPVSGVQFKGFLVEKFSTPAQIAAVTVYSGGRVEGNEIRFIHGIGVTATGTGASVVHNFIHDNGEMGVSSANGVDVLWQNNEIARNNTAGYNAGWEAGGGKLSGATNNIFDNNYSHNNGFNRIGGGGAGIWEDGGNLGNVFSNNYIADNNTDGIELEISYATQVFGNTITGNGLTCMDGCWGAGLLIENTQDVEAYNNVLDNNRRGFVIAMDDRGSGRYGLYEINNDYFHDNVVKQPNGNWTGFKYCTLSDGCNAYFSLSHAHWEYNTYCFTSLSAEQLGWNEQNLTPSGWQDVGQDQQGRFEVCGS